MLALVLVSLAAAPLVAQTGTATRDALGDVLPEGAIARMGSRQFRLDHDAMGVTFSTDGRRIYAVDILGDIRVWDADTGELLQSATAPPGPVMGFSPSQDRTRLAINREGEGASVVDAATGAMQLDLERHGGRAAFSPDGRWLAAWGPPLSKVDILGATDGATVRELNEKVTEFADVAFSPDGSLVALSAFKKDTVRSSTGTLFVLDTATGELVHKVELPDTLLQKVLFAPDGKRIAGGDDHGHLRVWDARSGELLSEAAGLTVPERALCWSPDGGLIASSVAATDRPPKGTGLDVFTLRDGHSLAVKREFPGHHADVSSIAFAPDGRRIASASRDRLVRLWDADTGARLLPTQGHETGISDLSASADGAVVLTAGDDGRLGIWNGRTSALRRLEPAHDCPLLAAACAPDGRLAASSGLDGTVLLRTTDTGTEVCGWVGDSAHAARALAFSPDGRSLASAEEDGRIRVRDVSAAVNAKANLEAEVVVKMAQPVHEMDAGGAIAFTVAFSPDGKWIASGTSRLRLFDAATGELARDIKGTSPIASIAFSPDGTLIATANADRTVRLYEAATGAPRGTASGQVGRVQAVAFSHDGSIVASASDGESFIRLWDAAALAPLGQLEGHAGSVRALAFIAPGQLASASADGTVLVWQVPPPAKDDSAPAR